MKTSQKQTKETKAGFGQIGFPSFPSFPSVNPSVRLALSGLVDGILAAQRTGDAARVTALEAEIDAHVFPLYALTPEEIKLVKGTK